MNDGTVYVVTDKRPLTADHIRAALFSRPRRRNQGFDEREVRDFLEYVAAAIAFRDHQLAALIEENALIKRSLRQWQSERFDEYMASLYAEKAGRHVAR